MACYRDSFTLLFFTLCSYVGDNPEGEDTSLYGVTQFKLTRSSCFKELLLLQLLDGVLGLVDVLLVFQEGPDEEWIEMAKMTFGEF
jgi:hypothetical protein